MKDAYRELMRRQLLDKICGKMSDEEKLAFAQLMNQDEHRELMDSIRAQDAQIARIVSKVEQQSWLTSFSSDVIANFTSAGILWLGSKLLRRI